MSPTKIKTNDDIYKSGVQFAHSKYALASINECRVLEAIKFLLAHKYEFEGDMITSDRSGAISLITSYAEIRKTLQSELNIALNSVQIAEALQILQIHNSLLEPNEMRRPRTECEQLCLIQAVD